MMAIMVSQPRRTTMSNVIHAATRAVRPMKIVPIIVKESGGLYAVSMAMGTLTASSRMRRARKQRIMVDFGMRVSQQAIPVSKSYSLEERS
jgi:hypothetical protein